MNETTITTVAAQPGWFIATIHCVDDADRGVLALDPIVAWEISRSASIEPSPGTVNTPWRTPSRKDRLAERTRFMISGRMFLQ